MTGLADQRNLVVVGASAGGIEALLPLLAALPHDCGATLLVAVHIGARRSELPQVLSRAGPLPAVWATHGQPIRSGQIYVAPPDHHLLISSDCRHLILSRGPKENRTRPAIDPLFRSAARACASRAVGLVLSGTLSDGTAGLVELARHGAVTAVQDPQEAQCAGMPRSALRHARPDYCLSVTQIAELLSRLCCRGRSAVPILGNGENEASGKGKEYMDMPERELKRPVAVTCPICGGAVEQSAVQSLPYFECHTGHRFAAQNMEDAQYQELEKALDVALRVLNERAELARRLGEAARSRGQRHSAAHWDKATQQASERAQVLSRFIQQGWERPSDDDDEAQAQRSGEGS